MKADSITEDSHTNWKRSGTPKTDWKRIDAMTDEDIDLSDCQELDENFFEQALLSAPDGTYRDEQGHVLTREEGIAIHKERSEYDLSQIKPEGTLSVLLAPDVAKAFSSEKAVNEALRLLVKIANTQVRQSHSPTNG